jgi:hypothetical protein
VSALALSAVSRVHVWREDDVKVANGYLRSRRWAARDALTLCIHFRIWIGMVYVSFIIGASAAASLRRALHRKMTNPPTFDASGHVGLESTTSGGCLGGGAAPRLR